MSVILTQVNIRQLQSCVSVSSVKSHIPTDFFQMEEGKAHGMTVVVACCENGGIGMKEELPWRLR